jgi:hypothetical protein
VRYSVICTHLFLGKEPEDASGRQSPSVASERSVGSLDILKDSHSKVTLVQRSWYMLGLQLTKDNHKNVLVKSIRPGSPAALCRCHQLFVVDMLQLRQRSPLVLLCGLTLLQLPRNSCRRLCALCKW